MSSGSEIRHFRRFYWGLQIGWLLISLCGLLFNTFQSQREVLAIAKQSAVLEKERSETVRLWAMHQETLAIVDAAGERQILSPAQVLSQVQSLLPQNGVRSRLISPVPLNANNSPDPWEQQQLASLEQTSPMIAENSVLESAPYYRELHAMAAQSRCAGCHPGYSDYPIPAALSIRVPLAPIQAMLAMKTIAFNLAGCFIWALVALGLYGGARHLHAILLERQRGQQALLYSNNLYSALCAANQAMMRIEDPQQLYQELCQLAVHYGQLKLASVSLLNSETQALTPVASAGDPACKTYIERVKVSTDPDYPEGRGPTSVAIREKRSVITNDFPKDLRGSPWEEAAREAGICASASFPVFIGENVVGAFKVYAHQVGFFTPALVEMLERLRDDLCFALLSNDHKHRQAEAQKALLESQKFNQVLLDALPYPAILARYSTRKVVNANRKAVEMGVTIGEASHCCSPPAADDRRSSQTIERQREDGRWDMVCWCPVTDSGDDDLYLHFAVDITERKNQEEQVTTLAHTDPLTGIANRLCLNYRMNKIISSPAPSFSLLIFDLDRFKEVNDCYGHTVGDQVLVTMAQRLRKILRSEDTACRWGGDEFVVLLAHTDEQQTLQLKQRISAVINAPMRVNGQGLTVTASIGHAVYPVDGQSESELFKVADKRMYRDKINQSDRTAERKAVS